jgi:predicted RND superfamily exporter protein
LKEYVLSKERYVKDLVSEDGKSTVIIARYMEGEEEFDVSSRIMKKTKEIVPDSEGIYFGGLPFLMNQMILLIQSNFTFLEPAMIFLIIFFLFLGFRKAGGVFLPLTVVLLSVAWTLGLMGFFGMSVDLLSGIMPVILVAMASADGIHIMRRYYEKRQLGRTAIPAIKETFSELATPILITTVTTMIGFFALVSSDFSVIRQFGFVTSLGIFLAWVVTVFLFPSILPYAKSNQHTDTKGRRHARGFRFMEHMGVFVFNHKIFVLILIGLIMIGAAIGLPRIKKSVDWTLCLQKGSKAQRAEMLLRRDFGGTVPVQILVKGDLKDAHTLKAMRHLERYLDTLFSVGEVQSIAAIISEMNEVMNDRYVIPETNEGVANLWFLIEDEDIVEQLVREDRKEALIQAKVNSWDSEVISKAVKQIDGFIERLPKRLFVADRKMLAPKARDALLAVQKDRITTNIFRDLYRQDMEVERERIEPIVEKALFKGGLKEDKYRKVKQGIIEYLLSDVAEIEIASKDMAGIIAGRILERIQDDGEIHEKEILGIIASLPSNRPLFINGGEADSEDINELSRSLEAIVSEFLGDVRVASAIEEIKKMLPSGYTRNKELFRDLKGDLWEMNEDLVALGEAESQKLLADLDPPGIKEIPISFENTGLAAVLSQMEAELIPTQIQSMFIAFVAVAIILSLIFKSPLLGLLGVIPITLTLLVNFSIMGYFKIGLDSFTAMIASIAIGLGIDTDVHFISCLKREFSESGNRLSAIKETMRTTGVAILINALSVGLGFAVLLLAGGQHIRRFGGLASLTILLSAFFTLTVLPASILLAMPKFLRKGE